jgi:hypothetical protein
MGRFDWDSGRLRPKIHPPHDGQRGPACPARVPRLQIQTLQRGGGKPALADASATMLFSGCR